MNNKYTLQQLLQNGTATVVYIKNDNQKSIMNCTLISEYIPEPNLPEQNSYSNSPQLLNEERNHSILNVWDLDTNTWQILNINSIKSIKINKN